jgi:hypothetical protein
MGSQESLQAFTSLGTLVRGLPLFRCGSAPDPATIKWEIVFPLFSYSDFGSCQDYAVINASSTKEALKAANLALLPFTGQPIVAAYNLPSLASTLVPMPPPPQAH